MRTRIAKTNMPSIERVFYHKDMLEKVRKGNHAKNPAILSFFFVTERTQLNAAHAQLLEKLRPIAFAENLPISNDPVVRISRNLAKKIVQKPRE